MAGYEGGRGHKTREGFCPAKRVVRGMSDVVCELMTLHKHPVVFALLFSWTSHSHRLLQSGRSATAKDSLALVLNPHPVLPRAMVDQALSLTVPNIWVC